MKRNPSAGNSAKARSETECRSGRVEVELLYRDASNYKSIGAHVFATVLNDEQIERIGRSSSK